MPPADSCIVTTNQKLRSWQLVVFMQLNPVYTRQLAPKTEFVQPIPNISEKCFAFLLVESKLLPNSNLKTLCLTKFLQNISLQFYQQCHLIVLFIATKLYLFVWYSHKNKSWPMIMIVIITVKERRKQYGTKPSFFVITTNIS